MSDRIVRALLPESRLVAVVCVATGVANEASRRQGLAASSGALLGQALAGGLLVASLQPSERTRVNLQVECDGPAGGVFVSATPLGQARGYIRGKSIRFPPAPRFSTAPLLGRDGYVSLLRDTDGAFHRGTVAIAEGDLSLNLERYFESSEQLDTAVQLEALSFGEAGFDWIGGVLVQCPPDGDAAALAALRRRMRSGDLERAVRSGASSAHAIFDAFFGDGSPDLLSDNLAEFACPCTRERVYRALTVLPNVDLVEMITQEGKASVDCEFCGMHYEISEAELRRVLERVDERDAAQAETARRQGLN